MQPVGGPVSDSLVTVPDRVTAPVARRSLGLEIAKTAFSRSFPKLWYPGHPGSPEAPQAPTGSRRRSEKWRGPSQCWFSDLLCSVAAQDWFQFPLPLSPRSRQKANDLAGTSSHVTLWPPAPVRHSLASELIEWLDTTHIIVLIGQTAQELRPPPAPTCEAAPQVCRNPRAVQGQGASPVAP